MIRELMEELGYDPDQLVLASLSSAEPERFAALVNRMHQRLFGDRS